jgi:hypothetical protein
MDGYRLKQMRIQVSNPDSLTIEDAEMYKVKNRKFIVWLDMLLIFCVCQNKITNKIETILQALEIKGQNAHLRHLGIVEGMLGWDGYSVCLLDNHHLLFVGGQLNGEPLMLHKADLFKLDIFRSEAFL